MKPQVEGVGQEEETTERESNSLGTKHRESTLWGCPLCAPGGKGAVSVCPSAHLPASTMGKPGGSHCRPLRPPTQKVHPAMSHLTSIRG